MNIEKIYERSIGLLAYPAEEWNKIRTEGITPRQAILSYVLPFAILTAAANLFGLSMFGVGTHSLPGIFNLAVTVVISFLVPLMLVISSGMLSYSAAGIFGGTTKPGDHLVLYAYALTPLYLMDAFSSIHWTLTWLMGFGIYSVYLLWTGIPSLGGVGPGKRIPFFVVSLLITGTLFTFFYWLFPTFFLRS